MISQPPDNGDSGGSGGNMLPAKSIRTIRMVERLAKRPDWEIPEEAYGKLPGELYDIAMDTQRGDRERLSAARTLAHFNHQNQSNHPLPSMHQHAHIHAEVGVSSIIGMMQAEVERRGILDSQNGNGNGS